MRLQVPKVHLTLRDVTKTTNHQSRAEWTNLNRVSELLSKLEGRLTIQIVHRGHGRLLPGDNDELLAILRPLDILDLVIENRDELPILALMDANVLQGVLSVVTLAR